MMAGKPVMARLPTSAPAVAAVVFSRVRRERPRLVSLGSAMV
jgi:hypothetical protein